MGMRYAIRNRITRAPSSNNPIAGYHSMPDERSGKQATGACRDTVDSRRISFVVPFPSLTLDVAVKLILAVIQPTRLTAVREALANMEVERLTVLDAQGYARQRGQTERYRGSPYATNLLRKIVLEIAVNDDFLDRAIDAILSVARTGPDGNIGDGKVFVLPMDDCLQLGGTERGPGAV